MLFKISKKQLLPVLKSARGMCENKAPNDLVTLQCRQKTLSVTVLHSELRVDWTLPLADSTSTVGEVDVSCKRMIDICSMKADDSITIESSVDEAGVEKTRITMDFFTDNDCVFELAIPNDGRYFASNYLEMTTAKEKFSLSQGDLKISFKQILLSTPINNPQYEGALLEINAQCVTLIATDGSIMAANAFNSCSVGAGTRVIIPQKVVLELSKLLSPTNALVGVSVDDNHIRFEISPDLAVTSKLLDREFPNWETIIPEKIDQNTRTLTANVAKLKKAITSASTGGDKACKFFIEPSLLTLSTGKAKTSVTIDGFDSDATFLLSAANLLKILKSVSTTDVVMTFGETTAVVIITDGYYDNCQINYSKFAIMPVKK